MFNIENLSADQLRNLAAEVSKLATVKEKEIDPELMRKMLEGITTVVAAGDLLVDSIEKLRHTADEIRVARGLVLPKT